MSPGSCKNCYPKLLVYRYILIYRYKELNNQQGLIDCKTQPTNEFTNTLTSLKFVIFLLTCVSDCQLLQYFFFTFYNFCVVV